MSNSADVEAVMRLARGGPKPAATVTEPDHYEEINRPDHYRIEVGGHVLDVIELIDAIGLNFHLGNALKYLIRAGRKPDASAATDLRKAAYYLTRYADKLEADPFA